MSGQFNWVMPNLSDYWDDDKDAIYLNSRQLTMMNDKERALALSSIRSAVRTCTQILNDEQLIRTAHYMVDALYRAANRPELFFDLALYQYLEASAATFCECLAARGLTIRYLIDNPYEPTFYGMMRPIEIYRDWFRSSGFVYIWPHLLALEAMVLNGSQKCYFFELLPKYIDEARQTADQLVEQCRKDRRHYVLLETDGVRQTFEKSMRQKSQTGIITVMRTQPPVQGSGYNIYFDHQGIQYQNGDCK